MFKVTRDVYGDGSHWGISDWYDDFERKIAEALDRGASFPWTTDWYASKKEIASGKVTNRGDGIIECKAWVSDDFDTEGLGGTTIPFTTDLDEIRKALDEALDDAAEDRRANALYTGFSVFHEGKWVLTYLIPRGFGVELDEPPGDEYYRWGWTDADEDEEYPEDIPPHVADKLAAWADSWFEDAPETQVEIALGFPQEFTYEGWTISPWKD